MSQIIHLSVKAQKVHCNITEGLRDKFYNFSMKMSAKDHEYLSEHSTNYKNPLFADAKTVEEADEANYNAMMEENKKLKARYLVPERYNESFAKMNTSGPDLALDLDAVNNQVQTRDENELSAKRKQFDTKNIVAGKQLSIENKKKISETTTTLLYKKDVEWDFNLNPHKAPFLEVRNQYIFKLEDRN